MRSQIPCLVAVAVILLCQAAAEAHKVVLYAEADGPAVRGEAYFPGGGPARDVEVRVTGPAGRLLGTVRTDANGWFAFTPTHRCDHTFVIDSGDGHRAECVVAAAELPAGLPPLPGGPSAALPAAAPRADVPATQPATAPPAAPADIERIVRQAVRKELQLQREGVSLQEVIAGIGYIFGIMGLWALLRRRPRRKGSDGL